MSSQITSPDVPLDELSPLGLPAVDGTEPEPTGDELPFESPEFGIAGFLPHLDAASNV